LKVLSLGKSRISALPRGAHCTETILVAQADAGHS
jgi:hypothetical protein